MAIHSDFILPGDGAGLSPSIEHLVDLIRWRARNHPDRSAYIFLADGEQDERRLTFGELDRQVMALAARLQDRGLAGERALLVYDPGLDYIVAFYACLYAGVVAVPVYPPDPLRLNRVLPRLMSIVRQADARVVLSTNEILGWSGHFFAQAPEVEHVLATDNLVEPGDELRWFAPGIDGESLAFLQYTSGSCGDPKGVILTHGNLLSNLDQMGRMHHEGASAVLWLPPYHDMGLIGGILLLAYRGCPMVIMSPLSFVQRPMRWLEAISRYRATSSGSPNFGYELCVKRFNPAECEGLDLSSWRLACNGSEPIRADTIQRFYETFRPYGLQRETFCPCYGMAESTLMVSCAPLTEPPVVRWFDVGELEHNRVRLLPRPHPQALALVSSGRPVDYEQVLIVDPQTRLECPTGVVGEIWVSGPNVAQGYWSRPEESQHTFAAQLADGDDSTYLRTGDLGFLLDDELYVTGRIKDLIIVAGRNHYPQDIEHTVEQVNPALKHDGGAVFALDVAGEERVVVVHEVTRPRKLNLDELIEHIRRNVAELHEVPVQAVVLIQSGSIPKTSSGKIQRQACKQMFLSGDLLVLAQWRADASESTTAEPAAFEPPQTGTEEILAGLWSEVLGIAQPSRRDNFFQFGGHSLLATQLMTRISSVWDIELPLAALFEAPTLSGLAERIDAAQDQSQSSDHDCAASTGAIPPLVPVDRTHPLPLSFAQQRLWFLDQLEPGNPFYNLPTAARLKGPLDVEALRLSLNEIVERHESLRTIFPVSAGQPRQEILAPAPLPLGDVDLRQLSPTARERELHRQLAAEAALPFELARGPLVRAKLFRLAADEHVLLLCMHHIIADGWSLGVLVREMSALYDAHVQGSAQPLPAPAVQYADFAVWQRSWLDDARLEPHLAWWEQHLSGAPRVLELPTDHPRPTQPTFAGSIESRVLPAGISRQLPSTCQTEGVTLFMFLLAGLDAVLNRYTGQDDLVVGAPVAVRDRQQLEQLVGFFANTLVLRTDLAGDPTFRELLGRVKQTTLDAYTHQLVPFDRLVERVEPGRNRQRSPLFQVALVLENAPLALDRAGSLRIQPLVVDNGTAKYDLTIYCWPRPSGIELVAEYSTELFEQATIVRLLAGMETLLAAAAARPNLRLSELPLASDADRQQLLLNWNDTQSPFPQNRTLSELLAEQVARTPQSVAVRDASGSLTYAELDHRANQLAHYLRNLEVGPNTLVGLCVERTSRMLVGLLGILKAGGAYVPLDPAYPTQRLAHMLDDAQVRVLVTERSLLDQLPPHEAEEVLLDGDWPTIAQESSDAPPATARPADLAYTIYTSGSTGKPKGVEITQRGLVNFLWSFRDEPGLAPDDVLVAVTTLSFDIAALEMFLPLAVGAQLVIAPRETAVDGHALAALLDESKATVMQATPATWRLLIEADWRPRSRFKILCGGEAMPPSLARELSNRCDSLWNVYGPTETTIWSTVYEVHRQRTLSGLKPVSIGRPIANTEIYILDRHRNPAPIGVPGELYIGGAGLARGYRNRPELTAEKFVPHPFSSDPESRLYRTGDQARWLADGTLEFLGRIDHQIKIRGYRVELGEIESVLSRHPAVGEAAVVLRADSPAELRLVAYFSLRAGESADSATLRRLLQEHLPDYMLPALFVRLDHLPHTPNGKLDRRALPVPDASLVETSAEFVPPATGTEQSLAAMWCEVLDLDRIGRHEQFFELGGHSLLATQLVSRIRALWDIELPLRTIFEWPTLCDLAQQIDAARSQTSSDASRMTPLAPVDRQGPLPLSFAQQRLWFLDQYEPGNPFYNLPTAARLVGPLDASTLEQSVNEVLRRHEGLRTVFVQHDGQVEQRIQPAEQLPLVCVDLRHLDRVGRDRELHRQMTGAARRPFDLARGPLLRATLFQLEDQQHVLLLSMHHIVADGWSLGVLVREIATVYEAVRQGRPSPLAELSIQYPDFAVWQQQFLERDELSQQLAWWREQLAELPEPLDLPTDFPRPRAPQFEGGLVTRELPADLRDRLHNLSRAEGVTFFMTLAAGFETLLWRYSGQERFAIGTPIAHRTRVEIEPLIGFFANTLVLPARVSDRLSFRELLAQVKQITLGAYAHQDVPFEKLVEALSPERTRARSPLFQVALVLENAPLPLEQPGGLRIEPLAVDNGTSKYDLTLFCWEHHGRLTLTAEYSTELFQAATIARMLQALESLLASASADPTQRLAELPLIAAADRRQLLVDFNRTAAECPAQNTLHELFSAAAQRAPKAEAVVGEGLSLSYERLEQRSNQLARHLRSLGVGHESLVGLCIERSPNLIEAMLGILKAGAAYVPLDPAWPAARVAQLLEDARVSAVIATTAEADRLPQLSVPVVLLDRDAAAIALRSETAPAAIAGPESLAYMIYTSGSTGRPKGVEVSHRALVNHAWHLAERFGLQPGDRLLQFISASFDASAEEIFPALASGATLVLYPRTADRAGRELAEFCHRERVDVWHLPTAIWKQLVDELSVRNETLASPPRVLLVGGESASRHAFEAWRKLTGGQGHFLHAYGLTEAAITSTLWETTLQQPCEILGDTLPIGRPIANTQVLVLDAQGQPTPIGLPGELYLGGVGLARGYHRRPDLTRERFVSDTLPVELENEFGRRLYRTGDRARWLADGNLEFLGRSDEQIKLHGLRIEPAEIEAVLEAHAAVHQAVVLLREDEPGNKQLVAYIVPQTNAVQWIDDASVRETATADDEQVVHWHTIFDGAYSRTQADVDPTFNIAGWNSSFTGQPFRREEMREWLDRTAQRIRSLRPAGFDRVLEIGCGTGLVLFQIAPRCRQYWATDFSAASIAYLDRTLQSDNNLPQNVVLRNQPADDFSGLAAGSFDLVVLNSVVQYFPSAEYLVRVIAGAMRLLKPGGAIFLGDLRSYPLLAALHASIELAHAADDLPRRELETRIRRRIEQEQELCVDPALFARLAEQMPEMGRVDVRLKRAANQNELTSFRYEVVLQAGRKESESEAKPERWPASDSSSLDKLRNRLTSERPERLAISGVPDARVLAGVRAWELVCDASGPATADELRGRLPSLAAASIDPEAFWKLGDELGYDVEIASTGSGEQGAFNATFGRRDSKSVQLDVDCTCASGQCRCQCVMAGEPQSTPPTPVVRAQAWHRYTTDPLRGLLAQRLVPALRKRVEESLPRNWMPSTFLVLESLPLTAGGKVDRRALPAPAPARPDWSGPYAAPRNALESQVAGIWEELLSVKPVGIHDSFFDLGGHSLLAVKLLARIEADCGRRLPLNVLFQRPTVAHLSELLARPDVAELATSLIPIQPNGKQAPLFCVHPAGGTVFCYRELAAALGEDQPFYGLQAQGLDGRHAPHTRLEDMAAHYIRAMREVQPAGPYHLGGWSLGGNIAYEMACQLREQGDEVGLLALLDAGAVAPNQKATEEDFLTMLLGLFPADAQLPLEDLRKLAPAKQLEYFVGRAQQAQLVALDGDLAGSAQHVFDVFQADVQAIVEHRPRPFTGRITLLRAAEQALDLAGDETLGWTPYAAGGIDVHVIPGDHVHMIREPSVQNVAACLRQCLAAATLAAGQPARAGR